MYVCIKDIPQNFHNMEKISNKFCPWVVWDVPSMFSVKFVFKYTLYSDTSLNIISICFCLFLEYRKLKK